MWARGDVMCLSLGDHGCGALHTREVTRGVPAKQFSITCGPCEQHLSGARKPRILKYQQDTHGNVTHQERIADADPLWSSTPETIPLSPDEQRTDAHFRETAMLQINAMNALGTAISNGLQIPPEMMYLLRKQLPADMLLPGALVCANGHDAPAGSKFCPECSISMAARGALGPGTEDSSSSEDDADPVVDLGKLHPQTLKKMCRAEGLPSSGTKDQLIQRLQHVQAAA